MQSGQRNSSYSDPSRIQGFRTITWRQGNIVEEMEVNRGIYFYLHFQKYEQRQSNSMYSFRCEHL